MAGAFLFGEVLFCILYRAHSCRRCRRSTMNFSDGREEVEEYVNQEYS